MSEKLTKTETALTVKSLEDSGIKTSINQNDLIDIVVQDKFEKIQNEVNRINEKAKYLAEGYVKMREANKDLFLKELNKIDPSITLEQITIELKNRYSGVSIFGLTFLEDQYAKVDNIYEIKKQALGTLPAEGESPIFILTCRITTNSEGDVTGAKGVKFTSTSTTIYTKGVKVSAKSISGYYKDAEALNKECNEFLAMFPNPRININKIARETKTKMNKAILKNQAPLLQEQMKKIFAIDL